MAASKSLPSLSASARQPLPTSSHWLDFEGSLAESRRNDEALRKSGVLNYVPDRPWKDRPAEDEGRVVPTEELLAGILAEVRTWPTLWRRELAAVLIEAGDMDRIGNGD